MKVCFPSFDYEGASRANTQNSCRAEAPKHDSTVHPTDGNERAPADQRSKKPRRSSAVVASHPRDQIHVLGDMVTKLIWVMFQEIHKARIFPAEFGNIKNDPAHVSMACFCTGLWEELRVLREFASHDYWRHPKYNQCAVVMHLFDLYLPRSVYEKRTDGTARDVLRPPSFETALGSGEHTASIGRFDTAVAPFTPI